MGVITGDVRGGVGTFCTGVAIAEGAGAVSVLGELGDVKDVDEVGLTVAGVVSGHWFAPWFLLGCFIEYT